MDRDDIVQALASTPTVLGALTRGLSDDQLRGGHGPDNWSIVEVLFHLRDVDEIAMGRLSRMQDEDKPFLPAFDQAEYARERRYQQGESGQALTDFTTFRARLVELLTEADLERGGRHEELGPITIGSLAAHLVSHDLQHLAQIAGR